MNTSGVYIQAQAHIMHYHLFLPTSPVSYFSIFLIHHTLALTALCSMHLFSIGLYFHVYLTFESHWNMHIKFLSKILWFRKLSFTSILLIFWDVLWIKKTLQIYMHFTASVNEQFTGAHFKRALLWKFCGMKYMQIFMS